MAQRGPGWPPQGSQRAHRGRESRGRQEAGLLQAVEARPPGKALARGPQLSLHPEDVPLLHHRVQRGRRSLRVTGQEVTVVEVPRAPLQALRGRLSHLLPGQSELERPKGVPLLDPLLAPNHLPRQ